MIECEFCNNAFSNNSGLNKHQKLAKYCIKIQNSNKSLNCNYCNNIFATKSALNKHQKSAKSCIQIQILKKPINCEYCNKEFNKNDIAVHFKNCNEKRIHDIICEKDKIIEDLTNKYEVKINELQDKIFDILKTNATKPTIINQNNQRINTINNTINNLIPITDDHLIEQSQFLTIDHIKDGASGYVKFALDYPFKDRIICVDYSRRKIKYKDSEGNLVDDPDMTKLSQKFFKAIDGSNTEIINSYLLELKDKLFNLNIKSSNEMVESELTDFDRQSDLILNDLFKARKQRQEIKEASSGNKPEIYYEFVKDICGKVTK